MLMPATIMGHPSVPALFIVLWTGLLASGLLLFRSRNTPAFKERMRPIFAGAVVVSALAFAVLLQ